MQDLDRDVAIVLDVVREIDRRHAAGAELALECDSASASAAAQLSEIGAHDCILATSSG